jgi:hypothetical protein
MLSEVLIVKSMHSSPNANNTFSRSNTCTAEGYADYAFNNGLAYNPEQEKTCALPISGDGSDRDPERVSDSAIFPSKISPEDLTHPLLFSSPPSTSVLELC